MTCFYCLAIQCHKYCPDQVPFGEKRDRAIHAFERAVDDVSERRPVAEPGNQYYMFAFRQMMLMIKPQKAQDERAPLLTDWPDDAASIFFPSVPDAATMARACGYLMGRDQEK